MEVMVQKTLHTGRAIDMYLPGTARLLVAGRASQHLRTRNTPQSKQAPDSNCPSAQADTHTDSRAASIASLAMLTHWRRCPSWSHNVMTLFGCQAESGVACVPESRRGQLKRIRRNRLIYRKQPDFWLHATRSMLCNACRSVKVGGAGSVVYRNGDAERPDAAVEEPQCRR
jgi:hypothetical protein